VQLRLVGVHHDPQGSVCLMKRAHQGCDVGRNAGAETDHDFVSERYTSAGYQPRRALTGLLKRLEVGFLDNALMLVAKGIEHSRHHMEMRFNPSGHYRFVGCVSFMLTLARGDHLIRQ
jgi:hypothetical protein